MLREVFKEKKKKKKIEKGETKNIFNETRQMPTIVFS